ncbi:MAG TPA: methyltransferase domain-containing protein [Allosphingosinicella sp.]|nr:methyltransferase domain-containing protein [Allosphingosinicella sp.]
MADRFVLAFHVRNREGRSLFVRRREDVAEYPGFWSIPTRRVAEELFHRDALAFADVAPLLSRLVDLRRPRLVGSGVVERRKRNGYDLHMRLVSIEAEGAASLAGSKYCEARWVPPADIVALFPAGGGTCAAMVVNDLIRSGRLSGAVGFVEIPPELAGADPAWPDNSEAWKSWAFDQYVEASRTEGIKEGFLHKSVTVDRYFRRRARELSEAVGSAVDLGCGNGDYVRFLRELGIEAWGVDLRLPPIAASEPYFQALDLESEDMGADRRYDLLTLNLVLPWIADLDGVLRRMSAIAGPRSRVLVSILAPDYAKNGDWHETDGRACWLIQQPVRRAPKAAMINHSVGPLIYYPRTILDYVSAFVRRGFYCSGGSYLFIDSELTEEEKRSEGGFNRPGFDRHRDFPAFAVMEFGLLPDHPPAER